MKSKSSSKIKKQDYRRVRYFVGGKLKHRQIPLIPNTTDELNHKGTESTKKGREVGLDPAEHFTFRVSLFSSGSALCLCVLVVPTAASRLIEGLPVEEFLRRNADDAVLMELGHYDILDARENQRNQSLPP